MRFNLSMNADALFKRRDLMVFVILLCLGVVIGANFYSAQMRELSKIKTSISEEKKKNELIPKINKALNTLDAYKKRLQKKDASFFMNKVAGFGQESNIRINSLTPGSAQERDTFVKQPLALSAEATYHQLGKFISKIENSPEFLRVERMSVSTAGRSGEETEKIVLTLSNIYLKDNK